MNVINKIKFQSVILILLTCTVLIGCAASNFENRAHDGHLCSKNSKWFSARNFTLNNDDNTPSIVVQQLAHSDTRLLIEDSEKKEFKEALVISGKALLTKDIPAEENYAIDIVDVVFLFQQMVLTLLDLASDKGPQETLFPVNVEIAELKYPIKATTPSASAMYRPPWKAIINMTENNKDCIDFKISFSYISSDGNKNSMDINGQLSNFSKNDKNKALPDEFSISDWKQYEIGPYTKKVSGGTIYDIGTTYIEPPLSTLGQLRKHLEKKDTNKKAMHNKINTPDR